jgi:3-oxoacyl-[acyl-carrier protein] reductase
MKNLRGKNALLTGASRGIGGHIALALAERGVNLALVARSADGLEKVKKQVEARGVKAVTLAADIGRLEGLGRLVEQAVKKLGPLDLLVNNAGIVPKGKFCEIALEENDRIIKVNLLAPMRLTHLVIPGMIARRQGHILNVASLAGLIGMAYAEAYTTSKHGLALQTDKLNVLGGGAIKLETEEIELRFKTVKRTGVGLSLLGVADRFVVVDGTLKHPRATIDPGNLLVEGVAAWASAGLSLVADQFIQRVTAFGSPCEKVLQRDASAPQP